MNFDNQKCIQTPKVSETLRVSPAQYILLVVKTH